MGASVWGLLFLRSIIMAASEAHKGIKTGHTSTSPNGAVITPHDSNLIVDVTGITTRALYIGGAGDVNVITAAGDTVLFSAVPAGFVLPIQVQSVKSTSTTATLIVALA